VPFFAMWQTTMGMYASLPGFAPEHLRKFGNMWTKFQEAWLDYVALQDIDYKASFRCRCPGSLDESGELSRCASGTISNVVKLDRFEYRAVARASMLFCADTGYTVFVSCLNVCL
jgi:hypothetical protein